jgi:vancomycin resistance protein YoaR
LRTLSPAVATSAAEDAAAQAKLLLSGRKFVGIGTTVVALTPAALAQILTFPHRKGGRLGLELDTEALAQRLRRLQRLDLPARDARWATDGKVARVIPAKDGRRVNIAAIGRSLVTRLESTVHRARFVPVVPAFTTEEAEKLKITELVSEFTTQHPCCAPRVTNIHLAADILDGTILEPGEKFSLNESLGKRTSERGFLEAPQIQAGRLQDAIGGGVSQIATTLFNAAFFAGLRLDAHQAHQFYISRYPMGREATVSWGGPELIFTNTWPAGLLMRFLYTDTSITVQFYSTKLDRRIVTKTEEPYGFVQPVTFISRNRALAPGETHVLQEAGPAGFTVAYTRKVFKGSDLIRNERYVVRYDPEHAYIQVGPKKAPPKKPKPGKTGAQIPPPVDEVPNVGPTPTPTPTPVEPPPAGEEPLPAN